MTGDLLTGVTEERESATMVGNNDIGTEGSNENVRVGDVPQNSSSSSVSSAIRAAAATSSAQTRFSFYDAKEVQLQFSSGRNPATQPNVSSSTQGNRFTFYNAEMDSKKISSTNSTKIDTGVGSDVVKTATVGNGNSDRTKPRAGRGTGSSQLSAFGCVEGGTTTATAPPREELAAVDNLPGLGAALSSGSTDEILRSLQETEEQRLQLLKAVSPTEDNLRKLTQNGTVPSSFPSNKASKSSRRPNPDSREQELETSSSSTIPKPTTRSTTGSATPADVPQSSVGGASSHDSNDSNPYEDAIKEALDLLRRHRSPPGTPQVTQALPETVDVEPAPTDLTLLSPRSRALRPRTPRENDRVLQSRRDDSDVEDDVAPGTPMDGALGGDTSGVAAATDPVASYEEAKLKAKQRQERMAEYASRLQEFKSSLPAELGDNKANPSSKSVTISGMETEQPPMEREAVAITKEEPPPPQQILQSPSKQVSGGTDESVGLSDMSQSSRQRDDEIQRGVERVLLAILERANNSRSRGTQASSTTPEQELPQASADRLKAHLSENALIHAMEELLGQVSSESLGISSETSPGRALSTPSIHGSEEMPATTISPAEEQSTADQDNLAPAVTTKRSTEKSVVDELLAEVEEEDPDFSILQQCVSPSSTTVAPIYGNTWQNHREEKKLPESSEVLHRRRNPHLKIDTQTDVTSPSPATEQQSPHTYAEIMESCIGASMDDVEDAHDAETALIGHIRPSADRCCVADDAYNTIDADDDTSQDGKVEALDRVLGPLSKKAGGTTGVVLDLQSSSAGGAQEEESSPSILESLSNVMKEAESVISYVTSSMPERKDKPEEGKDEDKYYVNDGEREDLEATELMRTLCAHLLPFGVDPSNQLIGAIPAWDETNPNEAGYRIIRLSKSQLRRVEDAFEAMINSLKRVSERQLNKLESDTANAYDATFVRELQEAEKLLDDEERRVKVAEQQKQQNQGMMKRKSPDVQQLHPGALSLNDDKSLGGESIGHPDFPGVKTAGKGEMGDLEYFHLPIIFKSHVTGFEPTKDLVLEPGNVVAGQYLVESELGSAAFSTAYRCIDLSSDNGDDNGHDEVCLKVIKNTKDFFDQSLDEIKILELLRQTGKCQENHIVEMKTFFYHREHLVIVTELLRQNLFEFGKFILDNDEEPYFTLPRLAYITRQVLMSLRFVHSLGLVHSDVKPENILLGSYSRAQVKLIDFGSSCYLTDRQSSYIQSRSYRAPEVVLGLPYDGKIDVWSLGCVVAEMFTGEVTFQNDSIVSMLSRIEAICGPFPRHMIAQGRQSGRFFTKSGLLYEVVEESDSGNKKDSSGGGALGDDSDSDADGKLNHYDIFQPKNTRLSSRLGFAADLMDDFGETWNHRSKLEMKGKRGQAIFTDFVRSMLTIDPDGRPTASEALDHPWMLYAATLTEEEIKYPSS